MKRLKFWRRKSEEVPNSEEATKTTPSEENFAEQSVYTVVPGSELTTFWDLETDEKRVDFVTQMLMGAFSEDERRLMGSSGRSSTDGTDRGSSSNEDDDG